MYNFEISRNAELLLRLINNKLNKSLLTALNEKGPTTVTDLHIITRKTQSTVSQYLGKLKDNGIVSYYKDGKEHYYYISPTNERKIQKLDSLTTKIANL